jgi:hypothetical protein
MSGPIVGGSAVISGARSARFAISEMGQIGSSALPALSCELTPKRVSMDSAINICLNLIEGLAGHRRHCVKRIQLTTRLRARACVIARTRRERQRCDRKSDGETDCAHCGQSVVDNPYRQIGAPSALGCWGLDCGGRSLDCGHEICERTRPRRAVAARGERDHQMFAVPKNLGRNVDFVLVRHSQLSNATRSIGRVLSAVLVEDARRFRRRDG